MIVVDSTIFVCVPKCGTHTLIHVLGKDRVVHSKHAVDPDPRAYEGREIVAFNRHPFPRMVSQFLWSLRHDRDRDRRGDVGEFERYVAGGLKRQRRFEKAGPHAIAGFWGLPITTYLRLVGFPFHLEKRIQWYPTHQVGSVLFTRGFTKSHDVEPQAKQVYPRPVEEYLTKSARETIVASHSTDFARFHYSKVWS